MSLRPSPKRIDLLRSLTAASDGALRLSRMGSGWPAEGHVRLGTAQAPIRLYVGPIGASHRDRDQERRFQNPGQGRPIEAPDTGLCLLLGLWPPPEHSENPIVVAMDAYRRIGLQTRFSMFMPSALLEEAASTGFTEHQSSNGETLYAFRASRLSDYLSKLVDAQGPGAAWSASQAAGNDPSSMIDSSVHIRPKVGMYAAFARLNYKPWFALAEFVDNALQSFLSRRSAFGPGPLQIDIEIDAEQIVITDRAAGIAWHEFHRAFSPSHPPPDPSGLSEFGLGMKAAACWFAREWTVRTSALGDPHERVIMFDVDRITTMGVEHLPIETRPAPSDAHYTVITLRKLRVTPHGRTIGKIREHLASIYRLFLQNGSLAIRFTSSSKAEDLQFESPPLLTAPFFKTPAAPPTLWRDELRIDLGGGRIVRGWAGLLETGRASRAGFSVFRRDRLIQGSADDMYRPLRIFRTPNSYTYQRLVGELHADGFDVSHTKDGIQWGGAEDDMLSALRERLSRKDFPLLQQAEGYRVRQAARRLPPSFGSEALDGAAAELSHREAGQLAASALLESQPIASLQTRPELSATAEEPSHELQRLIQLSTPEGLWRIEIKLVRDAAADWYVFEHTRQGSDRELLVRINLAHPFSESFVNSDENTLAPLVRLVAALGLAEQRALEGGVRMAPIIRQRVNALLRDVFGHHETGEGERRAAGDGLDG